MDDFQYKTQEKSEQKTEEQNSPDAAIVSKISHKCPNCGWSVSGTADICENCGEWLLPGKCNFCYAEFAPGQKFCTECGNPPEGIICSSCGRKSHFDFCPLCNIPLTEQASEVILRIENSVEFQNILNEKSLKEDEVISVKTLADSPAVDKKSECNSKFQEEKLPAKGTFILNIKGNRNIAENMKVLEQSRHNIAEEEKKISEKKSKEAEMKKLMEALREKTFATNQEARRFYGALKILIPKVVEKQTPVGWRCNAFDVTHNEGPQGCADPSLGGTWVYITSKEMSFEATEI